MNESHLVTRDRYDRSINRKISASRCHTLVVQIPYAPISFASSISVISLSPITMSLGLYGTDLATVAELPISDHVGCGAGKDAK